MTDPTELKDTVEDMLSDDPKRRLVAEFDQLFIRYGKLREFLKKYEPEDEDCPVSEVEYEIMFLQMLVMQSYMWALGQRIDMMNDACLENK